MVGIEDPLRRRGATFDCIPSYNNRDFANFYSVTRRFILQTANLLLFLKSV